MEFNVLKLLGITMLLLSVLIGLTGVTLAQDDSLPAGELCLFSEECQGYGTGGYGRGGNSYIGTKDPRPDARSICVSTVGSDLIFLGNRYGPRPAAAPPHQ
jgi:hypothetical protein